MGMAFSTSYLPMALELTSNHRPGASLRLSWNSSRYLLFVRYLDIRYRGAFELSKLRHVGHAESIY